MTALNINASNRQQIETVLRTIQASPKQEVRNLAASFARGNESAWSRFLKGSYNHPITWWVGVFQLQMQMGVWGHRQRAAAGVQANRVWRISQPLRHEAQAGLEGKETPLLKAIIRYNLKYRKADMLVVHAANSVTFRASVLARIKARFAGKGGSLVKKRNDESRQHRSSRRAATQAPWAVLRSLELATASPALARLAHDACVTAESYRISRMDH